MEEIASVREIVPPERSLSKNHVYVLDKSLDIVGRLEDLAPGERIYSVRFMGEKAYMVTFRQVDPLYVIDLSNPKNPNVLGFLKIPGVSDYLHPYDENQVIGVGRDATEDGR
ncbi:MAG: beta-propeller domain-containing protein, partial [Candidatus Aenigmarchaeota archaeon]|nr:beta-propeller domain-containing protein [Candidatus Aenigmarchaeota archaeon]